MLSILVFWHYYYLFTIVIDLAGSSGRGQYNICRLVEFRLFVKDMERYVLFVSIFLCDVVGLPTLAIGTFSTSNASLYLMA